MLNIKLFAQGWRCRPLGGLQENGASVSTFSSSFESAGLIWRHVPASGKPIFNLGVILTGSVPYVSTLPPLVHADRTDAR